MPHPPFRLRAIFFDAGNTLIYPRTDELAADLIEHGYPATVGQFDDAERRAKLKLDEWLWPRLRSGDLPERADPLYWKAYLEALMEEIGAPAHERPRLVNRVADGFRQLELWSRVVEGTAGVLAGLRAEGYLLGVISNSIGTMEQQLVRVGLRDYFDFVIDSAVVGVEKPHPEIFRMALSHSLVKAEEALFVGDIYSSDIGGASLVGMPGALVDRVGVYRSLDCPRVDSVVEIARVVPKMTSAG